MNKGNDAGSFCRHVTTFKVMFFCPVEKSASEVLDDPVNLWEEGLREDELSPEEIQMVWHLRHHYLLFLSYSTCRFL